MVKEEAALAAGRRIAERDFNRTDLLTIVRWKSSRPLGLVKSNQKGEISDALRLAVDAKTPRVAMATLCGLRGVGVPVASAILTMIDPQRYTVIDRRALWTLGVRRQGDDGWPDLALTIDDYLGYLDFCRARSTELGISLRDLDRALWQAAD
jgi:hypothetical protein